MAKQSPVTAENFKRKLVLIKSGGLNLSANIQFAVMFALDYFAKSDTRGAECLYLSQLRNCVHETHGLNVKKFDAYVLAHTNAYASKEKDTGRPIFKLKQEDKPVVTAPKYAWNEQELGGAKKSDAPMDVAKIRESLVKASERSLSRITPEAQCAATVLAAYMQTTEFKNKVRKALSDRAPTVEPVKEEG